MVCELQKAADDSWLNKYLNIKTKQKKTAIHYKNKTTMIQLYTK